MNADDARTLIGQHVHFKELGRSTREAILERVDPNGTAVIRLFALTAPYLPLPRRVYTHLRHLERPTVPAAATLNRYVRASMLDNLNQDYTRTARAKGLAEWGVIGRHVLRNALVPVVTLIALQLPTVFSGAVVTEQIFRVPGIGSLLISSPPSERRSARQRITKNSRCQALLRMQVIRALTFLSC